MDDRQFDALARGLGSGTSRRGVLRLLAGAGAALLALGRGSGVMARHGTVGPGDPCRDTSQCVGADGPMFCDWNGYDSDGGLNCCTYQWNPCGFDAACCGTAVCIGGVCGASDPVPGFPLGAQCSYVAHCLGGGDTVDCADNGGFVPACCLIGGQVCTADIDCCMPNSCIAGYCQ